MKIEIANDKLQARLSIDEKKAAFPTREEILAELKRAGVVYGIDEEKIAEIAREHKPVQDIICARSETAVNQGIVWKIDISAFHKPQITELNRADFKRPLLFIPVHENQILAVKTTGTVKTVTGEEVNLPESSVRFPAGRNTHISADGSTLYADINGSAFFENGLLHVDRVYHVRGDVNYGTGNIKFDGPVVIDGDVRSGFRVEARDAIYIGGNVEAANIYSQKGDVTVQYGVVGQNRAKILAGGSLTCGYIQDATIGVRKDVIVQHYIINGQITAGGKIDVSQNEGLIRGGSLTAEKGIVVKEVGSHRNVFTELKLRNYSENQNQNKLWELSRARSELMLRYSSLQKRVAFLDVLQKRAGALSPEKQSEFQHLQEELKRLENKINEFSRQEMELQKEASKQRLNREIVILKNLYPNVDIDISGQGFVSDELLHSIKVFRFKDEMIVESLLEMEDSAYDIFVPIKNKNYGER